MKKNHSFFSNLALNLAEKNIGKTNKNPSVGCIIVKDNSVISSAVTSINGRPHAEFNALNRKINFKGSHMYVTLEPCAHYGKTPPCTNIIKQKKIKKVFYLFDDPDYRTHKKAKKVLNKIQKLTKYGFKHIDFYKSYYLNKLKKLPQVDAKIAISNDFFTINKRNKWITNHRSRKVAHLLRSKYDCIISTSKSINKDNSLLNCRIKGLNNYKPDLVIIDRYLKFKKNLKIFNLANKRKTYIFTLSNNKKKISFLKKKKIKIIKFNSLENKKDFTKLIKKLFDLGKRRVLVESGLIFLKQLFMSRLINNLYLFRSHKFLMEKGYNNSSINFLKRLKNNNKINVNLENDSLFKIRIK
tara:strand:+ start:32 stop:1096 length:1065 start_codon:yes stop_codon:yes gene_type:complete